MIAAVMILLVLAGGMLQSLVPGLAWLGSAKAPFLLSVVLYAAVAHERPVLLAVAAVAGVIQDSLTLIPMGTSSFCFTVVGLAAQQSRDVVFRESLLTAGVLGAAGGAAATLLLFGMLVLGGDYEAAPLAWVALKIVGTGLLGLGVTPLVWRVASRLDRLVGNVEQEKPERLWPSGKRPLLS